MVNVYDRKYEKYIKWINTFATEDENTRHSVSSKSTEDEYTCLQQNLYYSLLSSQRYGRQVYSTADKKQIYSSSVLEVSCFFVITEDEYICSYICVPKPLRDFRISMIFIP